jgi:hypothetical protein
MSKKRFRRFRYQRDSTTRFTPCFVHEGESQLCIQSIADSCSFEFLSKNSCFIEESRYSPYCLQRGVGANLSFIAENRPETI